jgi:hypothetical protein
MKIAILGTRGIPNFYGGFEQFAEYLSRYLVQNGHQVFVYNSHTHPYKDNMWNGVNIIHKYDLEKNLGTIGQFFYDLNCILDSRDRDFDAILQLGYTSSSIWQKFLPKKVKIFTNMDGLEWKRTKYNSWVKKFLLYAEYLGANGSHFLIADSIGIQKYLYQRYKKVSEYIPYGAHLFENPDPNVLKAYKVEPKQYAILIARMEPENNIEVILDGIVASDEPINMLVVGNINTKFAHYLVEKYKNIPNIKFLGGIYDINILNNLRYYSKIYFHGHSVGGTNPSLLEAMASGALICAHKNIFNSSILGNDAFYFEDYLDVKSILVNLDPSAEDAKIKNNLQKIKTIYSWENILSKYERFIIENL